MFTASTAIPTGFAGAGGLVSEALSVLNGAHFHPSGYMGSLLRRYHQMLKTSATSTIETAETGTQHQTPTLSSVVLSELGFGRLSDEQWSRVVTSSSWTKLDGARTRDISVRDVIRNHKGHLRPSHNWQSRRHFSSLSSLTNHLRRSPSPCHPHNQLSLPSVTSLLRPSRWYASIAQFEDRANSETDNPQAQARYLESVVDQDPHYVIRRFESGRYAVNHEVRKVYQKALETVARVERRSSIPSPLGGAPSQETIVGNRENPFHVITVPGKGGFLREVWYLARIVIIAFLVMSFVSSILVTPMKTGTQQMTKEFRPDPGEKHYTFDDVQGIEEAKAEVQEIVEFLKNPEKFQRLGAKLPTGLLLIGPPGTGKTLLAKAIAGEADVPFFFASGSEFDEMFVGVGAARVRKLFEQARRHRPCVVFIDELDAVGGARIASSVHPYSRMTLNQLLVEMDGYKELEGVVIIGATNFPESLDKALIRPGRFDSQINIPLPDVKARHEILKVHAQKVIMDNDVDLEIVARGTPGFSGADLANLINQAALHGSAQGKNAVTHDDLDFARDKIIMGPERRSAVIEEKNRRIVAYHEGGHAIVALYTSEALPVHKATIMPRGQALGMVSQLSEKDELSWSKKQLMARMDVAMGGRVAEELTFGAEHITSGASSDLESATRIAKMMVSKFGMTDVIGPVAHDDKSSPATQKLIDDEVRKLLKESHERAAHILKSRSTEHKRLAEALLEYETLSADEIKLVVAAQPLTRKM